MLISDTLTYLNLVLIYVNYIGFWTAYPFHFTCNEHITMIFFCSLISVNIKFEAPGK
jgi:hypothetical protein